ncbi:hypothetical protein HY478_00590, partial [Candidatus Uhrbacteria bacterium]|nr:hypothetical protein [Candidatus Uhrbacteria bacterium]
MKRLLEIIPGALLWLTLLLATILSFVRPIWAIYFIILFDLLWLFRVLYFVVFLLIASRRYHETVKTDWFLRVKERPRWERIHHLIFLPTYKESLPILRSTFESLRVVTYPKEKFIIVLAGEERDREHFLENARALADEFGDVFGQILVTVHPAGLPDEIPGKGSNINYAGHRAQELVDELGIPYEDVIVSSFDVDTCVHLQYFAYL